MNQNQTKTNLKPKMNGLNNSKTKENNTIESSVDVL